MNKLSATGRVVANAEVKFLPNGDAVCQFRVASDVGYGDKKTTNWLNCAVFGKRGESLTPHLTKGQQVTVFGTLTLREWTNKDGVKSLSPDVRVDEIELQGGKREGAEPSQRQSAAPRQAAAPASDFDDDEIPF